MRPFLSILLILSGAWGLYHTAHMVNRPDPPAGEWWRVEPESQFLCINAGDLISSDGEEVASYVEGETWTFKCGNDFKIFPSAKEAIGAVMACGEQYSKEHGRTK